MAEFTRKELRTPVTDSANFSGDRDMELVNNLNSVAYFNIEGTDGKEIFNSASLTSLVNCSAITESTHAGFIVQPGVTATFTFEPTATINKGDIRFMASNVLVFNTGGLDNTGSAFGVNLNTNA